MIDPRVFSSTPHKSLTAFQDLVGQVVLMHAALIPAIIAQTGVMVRRYPIDAGAQQADLLQTIQQQHNSECLALGIEPPPDIQSFDLKDPTEWASFTFILANDLARIKASAGIV